ncbi:MAG: glycosyltransferase family 2 protein [Candidatus Hodarchaeota archaeon]
MQKLKILINRLPTLDVIIVNWNSGAYLRLCLESIKADNHKCFTMSRVVIVDNASKDCSLDNLKGFHLPLIIIKNQENLGFAAACNRGAKGSRADYLLFLNPDIRLFRDSLSVPLIFMDQPRNEKVGITGIQLIDTSGQVSLNCARFPSPSQFFIGMLGFDKLFPKLFKGHFMREWNHGDTRIVDQVMGAFFLVRRSVFEELDGFDERFFVYFEDLDFSHRAYQKGYMSCYLATAQAFHAGGGTSKQIKARRIFYSLRSRILYVYKHFNFFTATLVMSGTILIEPFMRLIWAGLRRSIPEAYQTIHAYGLLFRALPDILKETACKTKLKENHLD